MTRATLCACVPAALGAFDFGLLALAGPRVAEETGVAGAAYPWLFSASSFAYGAAVMPAAALTGRLGPGRALAIGLAGTAAGATALALAHGLAVALVARVLFGSGGALAATAAIALLTAVADDAGRRTGFAALGGAVAAGFAAGAVLAGVDGWRHVVLVAAATALVAAVAVAHLPAPPRPPSPALRGAALLTVAIVTAAGAIVGIDRGWAWAPIVLVLAGGLAIVALRRSTRWLPSRRPELGAACLAGAATTASGVGAMVLLGPALLGAQLPGALLGIFGLGVLPGAWIARQAIAKAAALNAAAAGLALQALALATLALVLRGGAVGPSVAATVALFGTGHVVANAAAAAAVAELAAGRPAPAAGLLIAAQYVGGGIGALLMTDIAGGYGATVGVLAAALLAALGAAPAVVTTRTIALGASGGAGFRA
jgi:MFS family permease